MELRYPISSELFTFVHSLNHTIERSLRQECELNVVQYRAMSCMRQAGELEEATMVRALTTSASQLSRSLGIIANKNYVRHRTYRGPTKLWHLTDKGNRAIENADIVLVEACDQVFGPLGPELGAAIRYGSMLTNQRHGIVRIENGRFFEEHACFEAFLQAERFTKETTKSFGLTETEFRIMFELHCSGPTAKSRISQTLLLAPSVVTDACHSLEQRSLLVRIGQVSDKRLHIVALTEQGRMLTEETAEYVDRRAFEDLRPSTNAERKLYQQMADIFVRRS